MKASRFAAELLLPEEALRQSIIEFCRGIGIETYKKMNFEHFATLSILLTVKYQMPLKAVLYRLFEEQYIKKVDEYIENYDFIKWILMQVRICSDRVKELYDTENRYVLPYSLTYRDMEEAYLSGYASREEIIKDAKNLDLDSDIIDIILEEKDREEDVDDDIDLFSMINNKG